MVESGGNFGTTSNCGASLNATQTRATTSASTGIDTLKEAIKLVSMLMEHHEMQEKQIVDLERKIDMIVKISSQRRLQQHDNLHSDNVLNSERMKETCLNTELQKDPYVLYQTIKEMFNEKNWLEEESLTSAEESELDKGVLVREDFFDTQRPSKRRMIKEERAVVHKKRNSKLNYIKNVENENEQEIENKLPYKISSNGWHTNDDVYIRQSIVMIIIKVIEHLRPDSSKMVKDLPNLGKRLEETLYKSARTKEEYKDLSTLKKRLFKLAEIG